MQRVNSDSLCPRDFFSLGAPAHTVRRRTMCGQHPPTLQREQRFIEDIRQKPKQNIMALRNQSMDDMPEMKLDDGPNTKDDGPGGNTGF